MIRPILEELTEALREAIPEQLVGLYLHGSFALGDADEHSDVDVIVAVHHPLDEHGVGRLQEMHARIQDLPDPWARSLEGSYVPLAVLRSCDRRGEDLWYLDNGARQLIRSAHCNTAVVRQTVRQHGIVIAGPEPGSLIDPVPTPLLRAEILAFLRSWGAEILAAPATYANRFFQGFIVLHFCRMWSDLETGTVGSKRRGAAWVSERVEGPSIDLIDRAWETRRDPARSSRTPADPLEYERTLEFVRFVLARVAPRASG